MRLGRPALDVTEKLASGPLVALEAAEHRAGDSHRARVPHPPHDHAHVPGNEKQRHW